MIHTALRRLLDTLLPPATAVRDCRPLSPTTIEQLLAPTTRTGVTGLLPFAIPAVRALIHANKFHHDRHASLLLAHALACYLTPLLSDTQPAILIPVPLGAARERERGHNQVTTVLTALRSKQPTLPLTLNTSLLRRNRETPMQSHLTRHERLHNVTNCFSCSVGNLPTEAPAHLILIDDVVTTGATLTAAAEALKPHLGRDTTLSLIALAY